MVTADAWNPENRLIGCEIKGGLIWFPSELWADELKCWLDAKFIALLLILLAETIELISFSLLDPISKRQVKSKG